VNDEPTFIVPLKPWSLAKTRLAVDSGRRAALARAFALDVLSAVSISSDSGRLVVVTAETDIEQHVADLGGVVLRDKPHRRTDGLFTAVEAGRSWARAHRPGAPVLVVPADLPCVTPRGLVEAIDALARHWFSFTPDAVGDGTTLLWASRPSLLDHAYGRGSAAIHERRGAARVTDVSSCVRHDVDDTDGLFTATTIGLGSHSFQALTTLDLSPGLAPTAS
jgi:2-phospho-L-lactate guanylyltransferase